MDTTGRAMRQRTVLVPGQTGRDPLVKIQARVPRSLNERIGMKAARYGATVSVMTADLLERGLAVFEAEEVAAEEAKQAG